MNTTCRMLAVGIGYVLIFACCAQAELKPSNAVRARQVEELFKHLNRVDYSVDMKFARLQKTNPDDYRLPYAFALVLIKHNRLPDAAEQLDRALKLEQKDMSVWKARIWLMLVARKYIGALDLVEEACEHLPREPQDSASQTQCCTFAMFTGQLFGYLAAPGKDRIDQPMLAHYQQRIAGCLPNWCGDSFMRGMNHILEEYAERTRKIDELAIEARQGITNHRDSRVSRLESEIEWARNELAQIEQLRANALQRSSAEREAVSNGAQSSLSGLNATNQQLTTQAGGYVAGLNAYDRLRETADEPFAEPEPTPNTWAHWAWRQRRAAWEANQKRLGKVADGMTPDLNAQGLTLSQLQGQAVALRAQFLLQSQQFAWNNYRESRELKHFRDRERKLFGRIQHIERDIAEATKRTIVVTSPRLRYQRNTTAALRNYITLTMSLDSEKRRIIASYRATDNA